MLLIVNKHCILGNTKMDSSKQSGNYLIQNIACYYNTTNNVNHIADCSNLELKEIPKCYGKDISSCSSITNLLLKSNLIKGIRRKAFVTFPNLKSLDLSFNPIRYIAVFAFEGLVSLKSLKLNDLSGNPPTIISDKAFSPLLNINYLTLSGTALEPHRMLKHVICHIPSSLETLEMEHVFFHPLKTFAVSLNNETSHCFKHLKLKKLVLSHNFISQITAAFVRNIRYVEHISVRRNELSGNTDAFLYILSAANLTYLDIGCQKTHECESEYEYPDNIPKWTDTSDVAEPHIKSLAKKKRTKAYMLSKLSVIRLDHFSGESFPFDIPNICWANNRLLEIDVSYLGKGIEGVGGTFPCLWYLKFFNLRGLKLIGHDYLLFQDLISLEVLLMANTMPGFMFKNTSAARLFEKTKMLTYLELSENAITSLDLNIFSQLQDLRFLNLSHNQIENMDGHMFENVTALETLILSHNSFSQIPIQIFGILERNMELLNKTMTLDIGNNPYQCSCQILNDIHRLLRSKYIITYKDSKDISLYCLLENGTHISFGEAVDLLPYFCKYSSNFLTVLWILYVVSIFVELFSVLCIRYRWKVKYAWYTVRAMMNNKEHARRDYRFDVFVSYCSDDEDWMRSNIIPKLEQDLHYNLCLHYRHFTAGRPIANNIVDAVEASRKTLLLITKQYMRSGWCEFETQFAQTHHLQRHTGGLIAIVHPQVLKMRGPRLDSLKQLLDYVTYLEWSTDTDQMRLFWFNLRKALGPPMLQIEDDEHDDDDDDDHDHDHDI